MATNTFPKSEKTIKANGFGLNEEEEANELALVFVKNLKSGKETSVTIESLSDEIKKIF